MAIPLTARVPIEFQPKSLAGHRTLHDFAVTIRVPTMMERDSYHAALIRGGVIHYTMQQIRDLAAGGVQEVYPADKQDENLTLLRELWNVKDDEDECSRLQRIRMEELYDQARALGKEAPDTETVRLELEKIVPTIRMDSKRRVKALAINQELLAQYGPLREAIASLSDQDAKRHWMNVETYVGGWGAARESKTASTPLGEGETAPWFVEFQPTGNGRGGITNAEAEYLRGQIGEEAFSEISDFITGMHGIDQDEEKNLASLLETTSDRTGSTQSTTEAGSENGSSTVEPSTPIPDGESPKTTKSSTRSTKPSATKTES